MMRFDTYEHSLVICGRSVYGGRRYSGDDSSLASRSFLLRNITAMLWVIFLASICS